MSNLSSLLGHFSEHFEPSFGFDQTEGSQLYDRMGLVDGLVSDVNIFGIVPFDFLFEHQNLVFQFDQSERAQLDHRLAHFNFPEGGAPPVPVTGIRPYIAIRLGGGITLVG